SEPRPGPERPDHDPPAHLLRASGFGPAPAGGGTRSGAGCRSHRPVIIQLEQECRIRSAKPGVTPMTDVPVINLSFFEPGFNQDPYPVLEQIRSAGPVVYNEVLDRWMVTSYQNVTRALGDRTRFAQAVSEAFVDFFGGPTIETIDDPQRHDTI